MQSISGAAVKTTLSRRPHASHLPVGNGRRGVTQSSIGCRYYVGGLALGPSGAYSLQAVKVGSGLGGARTGRRVAGEDARLLIASRDSGGTARPRQPTFSPESEAGSVAGFSPTVIEIAVAGCEGSPAQPDTEPSQRLAQTVPTNVYRGVVITVPATAET